MRRGLTASIVLVVVLSLPAWLAVDRQPAAPTSSLTLVERIAVLCETVRANATTVDGQAKAMRCVGDMANAARALR